VTDSFPAQSEKAPSKVDTTFPQTARIWNYWQGGKDNFAVDRQVGDEIRRAFPEIVDSAMASRAFLMRIVRYLTGELGMRQFLDIGTGLPTANNTHEVAQQIAPESRIVYVDNDPLVLVHARALLTSDPKGQTEYIDADLRDVQKIHREAADTLDFNQPVVLMLMGILGHIESYDEAKSIVRVHMSRLASGSHLVMCDGTNTSDAVVEAARIWNETANPRYHLRSPEQIEGFFEGLELLEPGVVSTSFWRPELGEAGSTKHVDGYCGVGRKP
jgi:hypothetical protein